MTEMNSPKHVDRRQFLQLVAGIGAAVGLGAAATTRTAYAATVAGVEVEVEEESQWEERNAVGGVGGRKQLVRRGPRGGAQRAGGVGIGTIASPLRNPKKPEAGRHPKRCFIELPPSAC